MITKEEKATLAKLPHTFDNEEAYDNILTPKIHELQKLCEEHTIGFVGFFTYMRRKEEDGTHFGASMAVTMPALSSTDTMLAASLAQVLKQSPQLRTDPKGLVEVIKETLDLIKENNEALGMSDNKETSNGGI